MFHSFSNLPREIRHTIWKLTVRYEPEVCLCWPTNTELGYNVDKFRNGYPQLPLTVDTAFPVAMHVCRESRSVVQHLDVGIRFRASEAAGCPVPFRLYIPDYDTLYISSNEANLLKLHRRYDSFIPILPQSDADQQLQDAWCEIMKKAKAIAFEGRYFMYWYSEFNNLLHVSKLPGPDGLYPVSIPPDQKKLSFVVASSIYDEHGTVMDYQQFKAPGRRCKLVDLSQEALQNVYIYTNTRDECLDTDPVLVPEAIDTTRKGILGWYEGDEWTVEDGDLEIVPQTFIEYQPDGTWKEVCHDRIFTQERRWRSQVSAPPVLFEDRPDPERFRVMDADIPFEPWCREDTEGWPTAAYP